MDIPDPVPCGAQHTGITTIFAVRDGGATWTPCPYCHVMIEGALAKGELPGPAYAPGRGVVSYRQELRLIAWTGWADFNGGS